MSPTTIYTCVELHNRTYAGVTKAMRIARTLPLTTRESFDILAEFVHSCQKEEVADDDDKMNEVGGSRRPVSVHSGAHFARTLPLGVWSAWLRPRFYRYQDSHLDVANHPYNSLKTGLAQICLLSVMIVRKMRLGPLDRRLERTRCLACAKSHLRVSGHMYWP